MASVSPPKPWERAGSAALPSSADPSVMSMANPHTPTSTTAAASASSSQPPPLPAKPSTLNSVVNRTASNYSPYGAASRYGSSPYGGGMGSGIGGYGSPYSRFGGMGNSMYGGGYGSMYGGMGMGGMGGMYGGMGQPGIMGAAPNDPNSLTNSFNQSTQATFQIIESIVGAFGGFAQMLETMVSVAEQFTSLRQTLGSILGIFTILRWFRTLLAKITGRPPPADATSLTPANFFASQNLTPPSNLPPGAPKPSKKPFLVFLLAVFGLPYLMGKLIRALARSHEAQQQQQQQLLDPNGNPLPPDQQPKQPIDPSKLDFCRLLYDYTPATAAGPSQPGIDLEVKKGDLVAVLSKTDPMGNASDWWRCRARDGRMGYLPGIYLEAIQRKRQITDGDGGSRAQTMTTDGDRTTSLTGPKVEGNAGDISAEGFMKSQFYN